MFNLFETIKYNLDIDNYQRKYFDIQMYIIFILRNCLM